VPEPAEKLKDVVNAIRRHLAQPGAQFSIGLHAQDEAQNDRITDREILHVLKKSGVHVAKHDQYSEEFDTWKYRIAGPTFEGRKVAVVVSFTLDPPLPMPKLCVITVFAL
jgi:hypothetical protein